MQRVIIVGPGASGKSTLARRLGELTGLPVVEIDTIFWTPDLVAKSPCEWSSMQSSFVAASEWIIDGDLGPFDVFEPRFKAADTVIFLDFSTWRCMWRAIRRSRERADFWLWLLTYRWKCRPLILDAIQAHAPGAAFYTLRDPQQVSRFLGDVAATEARRQSRV